MFAVCQILAPFTAWCLDEEKNFTKPPFIFELVLSGMLLLLVRADLTEETFS